MTREKNLSDFLRTLSSTHVAFIAFIAAGGYFLWTEHQAHLLAVLPFAIFLLCPLMHIFKHGHHGDHKENDETHNHKHH